VPHGGIKITLIKLSQIQTLSGIQPLAQGFTLGSASARKRKITCNLAYVFSEITESSPGIVERPCKSELKLAVHKQNKQGH